MAKKISELIHCNNPLFILRFKNGGISQIELSKQSGISSPVIARIERGKIEHIQPKTLNKIQEFFHVDSNEFYKEYLEWKEKFHLTNS